MKTELPEFDVLLEMAEKRPDQLEALRVELVEAVICSAREDFQRRLRGLQFQIDATRRSSGNPMAACIRISQMMHESLVTLRECLGDPLQRPMNTRARVANAQPESTSFSSAEEKVVSMLTFQARRQRRQTEATF